VEIVSSVVIGIITGVISSWLVSKHYENRAKESQRLRDEESVLQHRKRERALARKEILFILIRTSGFLTQFSYLLSDLISFSGRDKKPLAQELYRTLNWNEISLIWEVEVDGFPLSDEEESFFRELDDFILNVKGYFYSHVHKSTPLLPHELKEFQDELTQRTVKLSFIIRNMRLSKEG